MIVVIVFSLFFRSFCNSLSLCPIPSCLSHYLLPVCILILIHDLSSSSVSSPAPPHPPPHISLFVSSGFDTICPKISWLYMVGNKVWKASHELFLSSSHMCFLLPSYSTSFFSQLHYCSHLHSTTLPLPPPCPVLPPMFMPPPPLPPHLHPLPPLLFYPFLSKTIG